MTPKARKPLANLVYLIVASDMMMVYISLDPYGTTFGEELDLHKFNFDTHCTAGLCFFYNDNHLLLTFMALSTPGA
jgi:hypothetical protein